MWVRQDDTDQHLRVTDRARRILLAQALVEGGGVEVANRLRRSPHLTSEERDFAGDVLRADEVAHLKWSLNAAEALAGQRYRRYAEWQRRYNLSMYESLPARDRDGFRRDRALLLGLSQAERLFFRHFDYYEKVFRATLPEEFLAGLPRLRTDEIVHISWGQSIALRFKEQNVDRGGGAPNLVTVRHTRVHQTAQDVTSLLHDLISIGKA